MMPSPRATLDLPNLLLLTGTGAAVVVVVMAVSAYIGGRRHLALCSIAVFFACFALVKFAVAVRALRELRLSRTGGIDPRELYGSPARFWIWVVMKLVVAALALFTAIYILIHGAAHLG